MGNLICAIIFQIVANSGVAMAKPLKGSSTAISRPAARTAIETLRGQMKTHPRTAEGGFWHKLRYPDQMWLDGLFMASPFLAHYGKVFEEPAAFDDVAKQLLLMDKVGYDAKSGLYYHAWDAKRVQPWANKQTGQSPHFWGRALGWYAMALVDSLDFY